MVIAAPERDLSVLQSRVQEAKMASEGQMAQKLQIQSRRSSVPFSNRAPKVRFLRSPESYSALESGPCAPIAGGSSEEKKIMKKMKSILKKNEHPILINTTLLNKLDIDELSAAMTNDLLGNCKIAVDVETQRLYAAERQARGAIDIVTFPSAYSVVEPFSRFLGTVIICIETLEIVRRENDNLQSINKQMKQIEAAIQEFMTLAASCEAHAKKFLTVTENVFRQWSNTMKIKSEFYIEHNRINIPVYPNKTMPENVTLYEDVRDEDERYLYDGVITLALVKGVVCVWSELSNDGIGVRQTFGSMTLEQQCEVIITLINHSKDLVHYSSIYIRHATKTLTDTEYNEGFENVKKRLNAVTFDDYFDPLCGLDLKNSFGELVERKCELLNLANKMYNTIVRARKLVTKFHHFTMQVVRGQKETKFSWCPCSQFYTRDKITSPYRSINEIAINVPMSTRFQHIIFTPTSASLALLGEGDQLLDINGSLSDMTTSLSSVIEGLM